MCKRLDFWHKHTSTLPGGTPIRVRVSPTSSPMLRVNSFRCGYELGTTHHLQHLHQYYRWRWRWRLPLGRRVGSARTSNQTHKLCVNTRPLHSRKPSGRTIWHATRALCCCPASGGVVMWQQTNKTCNAHAPLSFPFLFFHVGGK